DRRAACAAKRRHDPGAARADLDVAPRFAAQHEVLEEDGHVDAVGGARHRLAIGTMTKNDVVRLDLRLVADRAAMAGSVDLHGLVSSHARWGIPIRTSSFDDPQRLTWIGPQPMTAATSISVRDRGRYYSSFWSTGAARWMNPSPGAGSP